MKGLSRLSLEFILLLVFTTSCQSPLFVSHVTPAPTPQCVKPTLTLGTTQFRVDSIQREGHQFPDIPKKKEVAFWVEGTTVNYVFGLSPTKENLALNAVLKAGDPAVITWADCTKDEYVIKSMDTAPADDSAIFNQSAGGITIFVRTDSSSLVIRGERPVVQPVETAAPETPSPYQFDVAIEDKPSADPQTVTIGLTITNTGSQNFTLTNNDVSLKAENASEIFPVGTEPALPMELKPGETLALTVSFPKPQATSAVLRVLDTTLDYYFQ